MTEDVLSADGLAVLRALYDVGEPTLTIARDDLRRLFNTIEALHAERDRADRERAACVSIVEAVATGTLTTWRDREDEYCNGDPNCGWQQTGIDGPWAMTHTTQCPVTRARTLVGMRP